MKQSVLVTKTRKEVPVDEVARNAKLLIRAGYIHKTMAGVYSFLPLGLRSLEKIIRIIREEMISIGGQELSMSGLQSPDVWEKSGRWGDDADEIWFRSHLSAGGDVGFGWTHEEPVTEMMRNHIHSYRDVPLYVYQFQTKFRNEKRAKSGIMRTREFMMKDLYSFCADEEQHAVFYEQCAEAYMRVFTRVGLGDDTYRTFASGGAFSDFSDEFQTVIPAGEDTIYLDPKKKIAVNEEVCTDETLEKIGLQKNDLERVAASEVGNIFTLGTKYSEPLDLTYTDAHGKPQPVFMGSYGIGPARLLGVIVEKYGEDSGMSLPMSVAPFSAHLIALGDSKETFTAADMLYRMLQEHGLDVLFDDRDVSAGEKFADCDLIGIPVRLVVSDKTHAQKKVEFTDKVNGGERLLDTTPDGILSAMKEVGFSPIQQAYA